MSITPKTREYRSFEASLNEEGHVTGYACVFNDPEVMFKDNETGIEYREQVDQNAFDGCDMSDVVFVFDHTGKPAARTRNKTLALAVDQHGLGFDANLSGTQYGRDTLEEIKGGYLDKMSYSYHVAEDSYDAVTHTRTIRKIDKLFDVSVVTFPAYEATSVSARDFYSAQAEAERKAVETTKEVERRRKALEVKIKTLGY